MSRPPDADVAAQQRYAVWLERGTRVGLALLVLGFAAYASGLVAPHVPIERLPELWTLPSGEFLRATGLAPGWGWIAAVHRGDIANVAAIALLASCSIPPLAAAAFAFRRRGETAFAVICAVQVAVLLLAASGLLAVAH